MKILNENKNLINRKKILYDQRYTMSRLARDLNLTPVTVGNAIKGKTESTKTNKLIANKLGVTLVAFWPELYGEEIVHQGVDHLSVRGG